MNILQAITTILLCTLFFSFPAACAFSESGDVQSLKGWLPKQSVQTDSRKNINNPEPDAYSDGDGNNSYAGLPVDCSKISSPVESAICSDNDLLALDYFMSHIWSMTRNRRGELLPERQVQPVSPRSLCAGLRGESLKQCLTMQYYSGINDFLIAYPGYIKDNYTCGDVLAFTQEISITSESAHEYELEMQFLSAFLHLISNELLSEQDVEDIFVDAFNDSPTPDEELGLRLFQECSAVCGGYKPLAKKLIAIFENAEEGAR